MYLDPIAERTEVIELFEKSKGKHIRAEWISRCKHINGVDYKGGMVFSHYGTNSVFKYALEQFKRQADEVGVMIDEIVISQNPEAYTPNPEPVIRFVRSGASFENKTPSTGRCVEIF